MLKVEIVPHDMQGDLLVLRITVKLAGHEPVMKDELVYKDDLHSNFDYCWEWAKREVREFLMRMIEKEKP